MNGPEFTRELHDTFLILQNVQGSKLNHVRVRAAMEQISAWFRTGDARGTRRTLRTSTTETNNDR